MFIKADQTTNISTNFKPVKVFTRVESCQSLHGKCKEDKMIVIAWQYKLVLPAVESTFRQRNLQEEKLMAVMCDIYQ